MGKGNKAGTRAGSSGRKETSAATEHAPQTPGELEAHAMAMINKNLTGGKDMMTVPELRDMVRAKFGDHAASPAIFDKAVLGLRRERKIELQAPGDRSFLTSKDFSNAIPDYSYSGAGREMDSSDVYMYILKSN